MKNPSKILFVSLGVLTSSICHGQAEYSDPGLFGTAVIALAILLLFLAMLSLKVWVFVSGLIQRNKKLSSEQLRQTLEDLGQDEIELLLKRQQKFQESADQPAITHSKEKGELILHAESNVHASPMFDRKKQSTQSVDISSGLKKLILAFIASSAIWLIFGTSIGQYLGMKFVWPDLDHISWLSFGRLRPVHTNAVFWGWASMAMIGLGYFVVQRTCNTTIYSVRLGWISLWLINASVFIGSWSLMAGISNGGGEYREYIWPIAALFAVGLIITLYNFYQTIARRNTKEIYVSNWYILGACTWTLILVTIGYLPFYQDGLGETVIQGYYMHQGVGMWFMTFTLGLMYYFLPQSLNKPIYSYSLGVLAFWTQMVFYTLIGTHHFIFSPIPWWLQTVAIVFSAGMLIPVIAGTTNFLMTFRGAWSQLKTSYVLPFLLVGIFFYFIGSAQGSMQAFRLPNLIWHLNDFNVAHSHMTMYGIISFMMWGCIYYLIPRVTGKNPRELLVGAHFWMAFVGLMFYMFSMMIGGTLRGISWLNGDPFIESVILMAPYWLWRAIGGTMMFISHLIFAFNIYQMYQAKQEDIAMDQLIEKHDLINA